MKFVLLSIFKSDALSGKIGFYVQADVTPIACLELGLGITRKNILVEAATGSGENNGYFLSTLIHLIGKV